MMTNNPVYIVHLKPEPKVDGIRALKAGLKTLETFFRSQDGPHGIVLPGAIWIVRARA